MIDGVASESQRLSASFARQFWGGTSADTRGTFSSARKASRSAPVTSRTLANPRPAGEDRAVLHLRAPPRRRDSLECSVRSERNLPAPNALTVTEPIGRLRDFKEDTMVRTLTTATESRTDELELTLETLKDLTVTGRQAQDVKGGPTTPGRPGCYCGTW